MYHEKIYKNKAYSREYRTFLFHCVYNYDTSGSFQYIIVLPAVEQILNATRRFSLAWQLLNKDT